MTLDKVWREILADGANYELEKKATRDGCIIYTYKILDDDGARLVLHFEKSGCTICGTPYRIQFKSK